MIRNLFRDFLELLCLVPPLLCIALITPHAHAAEIIQRSHEPSWRSVAAMALIAGLAVYMARGWIISQFPRRERGERE